MKNFRRILLASSLALAATGLASANTIGTASCTGTVLLTCTITETAVGGPSTLNVSTGNGLISFDKFGNLGIAGTLTGTSLYVGFQTTTNSLSAKNNATDTTDATTFTFGYNNQFAFDPASTLASADTTALNTGLGVAAGSTFLIKPGASIANQAIASGATFSIPNPVSAPTTGYYSLFGEANLCGLGTTSTSQCALSGDYSGAGTFSVGILDTAQYVSQITGTGTLNLTVLASSVMNEVGSVTYTYTVNTAATPEPATFALFGGALLGAGLLRKRMVR